MTSKPILTPEKVQEKSKSILLNPSKIVSRRDNLEGEVTEIAAHISVPPDGGWGWVVVMAGFMSFFILDGTAYSFGSLINSMSQDLNLSPAAIALINSVAIALYFCASPIASALINRFGFRFTTMTGSVICSLSFFFTYFIKNYFFIVFFSGFLSGIGYAFVNMGVSLVVGFYFEKHRAIAFALSSSGSGIGVMVSYPINEYFSRVSGWRNTFLLQSGLFGIIYYLALTFRPLLSITVTKEDSTRIITYLPALSHSTIKSSSSDDKIVNEKVEATTTERLFSAVSNINFPTAAAVFKDEPPTTEQQAGPSTKAVASIITLKIQEPQNAHSRRSLKQVQSKILSTNIVISVDTKEKKKSKGCWGYCCCWEKHVHEARPLYRDDAFYTGKVEDIPAYNKQINEIPEENRTGLEYHLAVSRTIEPNDLVERRGVFTIAVRRVLATMIDTKILKRKSFMLLSISSFFIYVGYLTPFVYIDDRSKVLLISKDYSKWFVSTIGITGVCSRIILGAVSAKLDPTVIFSIAAIIGGTATIASSYISNIIAQFSFCTIYGFFEASMVVCRTLLIVKLYGLDHLTNASGMLLLFQGIASLISTPIAGVIMSNFGIEVAFSTAGSLITFGGLLSLLVPCVCKKEGLKESLKETQKYSEIRQN